MHNDESEVVDVLGAEASDLLAQRRVRVGPSAPIPRDLPIERVDPRLRAIGTDRAVNVAAEVHHANLAVQVFVDELGALWLTCVIDVGGAHFPGADSRIACWNVQCSPHVCLVEVGHERRTKSAWRQRSTVDFVLGEELIRGECPRCVVSCGHASSLFCALFFSLSSLRIDRGTIANTVNIVDVNFAGEGEELRIVCVAKRCGIRHAKTPKVAISSEHLLTQLLRVERVPEAHINVAGRGVIRPIRHTIPNSKPNQIRLKD